MTADEAIALVGDVLGSIRGAPGKLVGSTYIQGTGQDFDVLHLVDSIDDAKAALLDDGFVLEGEESYDTSTFYSLRKGEVNALITADHDFYGGFIRAANVCRYLAVTDKAQRVAVHRIIMDGELQ